MSKQYLSTFSAKEAHSADIFAIASTSTSILSASGSQDLLVHSVSGLSSTPDADFSNTDPFPLLQKFRGVHRLGCHHLVTSRDARRAASVGFEGDLVIWSQSLPSTELIGNTALAWVEEGVVKDNVKPGDVWAIALSADSQYLASTAIDGRVNVWDLNQPRGRDNLQHNGDNVTTKSYKTNNPLEQKEDENDQSIGVKIREYSTRTGFGMCIDLSSDGNLTAIGSSTGHVMILSNTTGRPMLQSTNGATTLGSCAIRAVKFSPHNSLLAAAGDTRIIALYSIAGSGSGEEVGLLKGHAAWIFAIDWSMDGTLLLSGDWNGQARVWDIESRQCLWTGAANADGVIWSLSWLPYPDKSPMLRQRSQGFVIGGKGGNLVFFRESGAK